MVLWADWIESSNAHLGSSMRWQWDGGWTWSPLNVTASLMYSDYCWLLIGISWGCQLGHLPTASSCGLDFLKAQWCGSKNKPHERSKQKCVMFFYDRLSPDTASFPAYATGQGRQTFTQLPKEGSQILPLCRARVSVIANRMVWDGKYHSSHLWKLPQTESHNNACESWSHVSSV